MTGEKCTWKFNENAFYWETACGNANQFMDEGPKENHYIYCPYCGKKIEETK
ncbi:MAG: hypothetical protein MUO31_06670 [Thermodesulfovibrionales bacterium]|nr:hypothetical protein [Thermodesulfovibrionales bacterium]